MDDSSNSNGRKDRSDVPVPDLTEGRAQMLEPIGINYSISYLQHPPDAADFVARNSSESVQQQQGREKIQDEEDDTEPIPIITAGGTAFQQQSLQQDAQDRQNERNAFQSIARKSQQEHRQYQQNEEKTSIGLQAYTEPLSVNLPLSRQRSQESNGTNTPEAGNQLELGNEQGQQDDTEPLPLNLSLPRRQLHQVQHSQQDPGQQAYHFQDVEPFVFPPPQHYFGLQHQTQQQPHHPHGPQYQQEQPHFPKCMSRHQDHKSSERRQQQPHQRTVAHPELLCTSRQDSEPLEAGIEPQPWRPTTQEKPMQHGENDWWESSQAEEISAKRSNNRVQTPEPLPPSPSPPLDGCPLSPHRIRHQSEPQGHHQRRRMQHHLPYTPQQQQQQVRQLQMDRPPPAEQLYYSSQPQYHHQQHHEQQFHYYHQAHQPAPDHQHNTYCPPDSSTVMNNAELQLAMNGNPESVQQHWQQRKKSKTGRSSTPKRSAKVTGTTLRVDRKEKESPAWVDNYLLRVHNMLEDAEPKRFSDIVSWQNHGRAFKIHRAEVFYDDIMPKYFNCKRASFHRWLRGWGFVRLIEGPDRGAYFHRYFARGLISLIKKKTRYQMCEAMESWCNPGNVLDFPSRSEEQEGDETTIAGAQQPQQATVVATKTDDKILRGKILHEVREMLRMAEIENFSDIVSWSKRGTSFKIHDRALFKEEIMKKYTSCSKLTYFSDTLRSWGFSRLKKGKGDENNAYYHRLFQKDRPELCRSFTKEQMFESMKEYREEQKRLKETSWSLLALDVKIGRRDDPHSHEEGDDPGNEGQSVERGIEALPSHTSVHAANKEPKKNNLANNLASFEEHARLLSLRDDKEFVPFGKNQKDKATKDEQESEDDTAPLPFLSHAQNNIDPINCLGVYPSGYFLDSAFQAGDSTSVSTSQIDVPLVGKEKGAAGASGVDSLFPSRRKTYICSIQNMLDDAEPKGFGSIVSWQSHGRSFKVHNAQRFEKEILPKYFHGKLLSFNRHLLAWGFVRLTIGKDRGGWYHRFFVRGATDLVQDLSRQQMLDAMTKWIAPGNEPDFYSCGKGDALSERLTRHNTESGSSAVNTDQQTKREEAVDLQMEANESKPDSNPKAQMGRDDPKKLRGSMIEDIREMLEVAIKERSENVVGWLLHGKAFKIHKKEHFVKHILPRFSKCTKFENFADALRAWGFVRLKKNRDRGAFYHKLFQKDQPRLTLHLSRKQMKMAMSDWKSTDGTEPDLYDGISEDVLLASEQMQALRGKTKKKRSRPPAIGVWKKPRPDTVTGTKADKDGSAKLPHGIAPNLDTSLAPQSSDSFSNQEELLVSCCSTAV